MGMPLQKLSMSKDDTSDDSSTSVKVLVSGIGSVLPASPPTGRARTSSTTPVRRRRKASCLEEDEDLIFWQAI
jgi:hypothetical protein